MLDRKFKWNNKFLVNTLKLKQRDRETEIQGDRETAKRQREQDQKVNKNQTDMTQKTEGKSDSQQIDRQKQLHK